MASKGPEIYGFNLQRLRKKKGIKSQAKLAQLIGTSRKVIKSAEEGLTIPESKNREKIAEVLKADETEFWRDPSEFDPQHGRTEKVRNAVKSVLEAAGYSVEDLPELFGFGKAAKKRADDGVDESDPEVKKDKALIDQYLAGKKKKKQKSVS